MSESSKVAFVFCVEPGRLESEACLLAESIRTFAGRFASGPIYAVQPRGNEPLKRETLSLFDSAGVIHRAANLNVDYARWPTSNKVYAIAHLEKEISAEFVAFLDTDSVVLNEPAEFVLRGGVDLAVQPTLRQFRGSTGPGDPNDSFWLKLYAMCEAPEPEYVHTMLDRVRIRGYYNGGLIVFRREAGLGRRWHAFLKRIAPSVPGDIRYNMDQFALALVAASVQPRVHLLPGVYNYNLARREEFILESMRDVQLDDLVHIHYHEAFRQRDFLETVRPSLESNSRRYQWLAQRLPLPGVE